MNIGLVCSNRDCPSYKKIGAGNIRKFGFNRNGTQRYQCKTCKQTLTATVGTLFHAKRRSDKTIIECLKLLAIHSSLKTVSELTQIHRDTLISWLAEAAKDKDKSATLLLEYGFSEEQIAKLWTCLPKKHSSY